MGLFKRLVKRESFLVGLILYCFLMFFMVVKFLFGLYFLIFIIVVIFFFIINFKYRGKR